VNLKRQKEVVLDKICVESWKSVMGEIGRGQLVPVRRVGCRKICLEPYKRCPAEQTRTDIPFRTTNVGGG
jgi:hypothetical protein